MASCPEKYYLELVSQEGICRNLPCGIQQGRQALLNHIPAKHMISEHTVRYWHGHSLNNRLCRMFWLLVTCPAMQLPWSVSDQLRAGKTADVADAKL